MSLSGLQLTGLDLKTTTKTFSIPIVGRVSIKWHTKQEKNLMCQSSSVAVQIVPIGVHAVDRQSVVLDDHLAVNQGELDDSVEGYLEVGQLRKRVAQQQSHQAPAPEIGILKVSGS
jgi:hypothetical protein